MARRGEDQRGEDKRLYWDVRLQAWKSSRLKQAGFCRREAINYRNFRCRKRRFSKESNAAIFTPLSIKSFVGSLDLALENACHIKVSPGFDTTTLKVLVMAVRGL